MSGTQNPMALIAKPGDPDLDLDVDGVTLVSVVMYGTEILARFEGGFGEFDATDGTRAVMEPGDPVAGVTEMNLTVGYTDPDPEWFAKVVEQLEKWRDTATPLRVCAAQGRMTTVIEDRGTWLPFPRSAPTDGQ